MKLSEEAERNIADAELRNLIRKLRLIDRAELAGRLRAGGALQKYERDFLADLVDGKKPPRHRPQSITTAVRNDGIAEWYLWLEAGRPDLPKGLVAYHVGKHYSVGPDYVRRVVRSLSPFRRKQIENNIRDYGPLSDSEAKKSLGPK